jgi:tetratricopeptide (TPR) repeat protein
VLAACLPIIAATPGDGSQLCGGCHRQIWETYRRTGMARSFSRPTPENVGAETTYYHRPSDSYFAMIHRGNEYFQRRYQLDPSGKPTNVMEKRVDYVMGSGNHSRAYLHRTASNTLVELPLAWYSEKGGSWAMNPGYDRPDHDGFRRPITYDCIFCHNAYPEIPQGQPRNFGRSVYVGALPEGIDCQRCHGPGSRHVELAGTPGATSEAVRNAIVNPARLSPERQVEVCMSCHLETTSFPLPNGLRRYERGPFSYVPGEPLERFLLNFDHAPGTGREDKFEIAGAAYRLGRSECFLKSGGKLTCTTCHNPHDIPRGEEAMRHYAEACRQCHAASFDRLVKAGQHTAVLNCAGCHMPKRRTEDVVHVVVTDHYIQRRKPAGDLQADMPERQETGVNAYRGAVVPYYPATLAHTAEDDLLLAVAQVKQGSNVAAGIPQLIAAIRKYEPQRPEYYLDLAGALEASGRINEALTFYREAIRKQPGSPVGPAKLGTALRRAGQNAEAEQVLRRSIAAEPDNAITWHELGLTYRALGKPQDAVAALTKAITLDPDLPEAQNNLAILMVAAGDRARAESAFREAIRIQPDYADAHGNLANLLAGGPDVEEARRQFEIALRLRPADGHTRYNYALLLGRTGHLEDAQHQLEEAVRSDASFADAHEVLGDLLQAKGHTQEAMSHYREALRIHPDSGRAHLGLGTALATSGDTTGAVTHLQKAAASPDPRTREQANGLLRQITRK